jgi:hypothetical protein
LKAVDREDEKLEAAMAAWGARNSNPQVTALLQSGGADGNSTGSGPNQRK